VQCAQLKLLALLTRPDEEALALEMILLANMPRPNRGILTWSDN